jgi:hypothetical protein
MMPSLLRPAVLLLLLPLAALAQSAAQSPSPTGRTPVLVELFTSEGCSSCPPADKLLATLAAQQPVAGARVIVLEEHVDYWDQGGWHDRFSSSQFTTRQNLYAPRLKFDDPYTPQMVVDGQTQFVGNDSTKAVAAITQAAQGEKLALMLGAATVEGKRITCTVSAANAGALPRGDLYAVLVDPSASTEVRAGENGGKRLEHVSVVRSFQRIGRLQDLSKGPVAFKMSAPSEEAAGKMRLVVFAQLPDQGAVRGVAERDTAQKP